MASNKIQKIFLCLIFALITNISYAQLETVPVDNDTALYLNSKILDESRSIWVHLPPSYSTGNQQYPVLYLLDGDGHFKYTSQLVDYLSGYDRNRMPEMIVVGIVNINRGKDLTLIHDAINAKNEPNNVSTTAGAGKFLKFIQQELVPKIESAYRTQPYRILMGHSLAGQFALYAKNTAPNLFKSTILISPAIFDDNKKLIDDFGLLLQKQSTGKLIVTIGNENTDKVELLVQQLKTHASKNFKWDFKQYKEENHFSVTYKSMFDALKFIYADWFMDFYGGDKVAYSDIAVHFDRLSKDFGYTIKPTEDFVNNCGYTQLKLKNIDNAIDIFKHNVENFPTSFNAYDSLGEAYKAKGEKKLAIANYEKSIELNPNNENGKEMLKELRAGG